MTLSFYNSLITLSRSKTQEQLQECGEEIPVSQKLKHRYYDGNLDCSLRSNFDLATNLTVKLPTSVQAK